MKKTLFAICASLCLLGSSCVERSEKYLALQAKLDTLQMHYQAQSNDVESMLAGINEISAGMQALREAEQILSIETSGDRKGNTTQAKIATLRGDITAIEGALNSYKEQLAALEGKSKKESAELRRLIANLKKEVEARNLRIEEISAQLAEREKEIGFKNQQIASLNQNVENLQEESIQQRETIASQDQDIHRGYFLLGGRKNLRDADVITRKGIFCPPVVSDQAQMNLFTEVDIRQARQIPLQSKKAKVLSTHSAGSYSVSADAEGMQVLTIHNTTEFWKQTRYLVVMINE